MLQFAESHQSLTKTQLFLHYDFTRIVKTDVQEHVFILNDLVMVGSRINEITSFVEHCSFCWEQTAVHIFIKTKLVWMSSKSGRLLITVSATPASMNAITHGSYISKSSTILHSCPTSYSPYFSNRAIISSICSVFTGINQTIKIFHSKKKF